MGFVREVPAHRALQVLPGACLEAGLARQAPAAAARALPLQQGRVSLAVGNAADAMAGSGGEAFMTDAPRVLLINPTITGRRHARFPLAVLSLATALEGRYAAKILDGNIDRDFVATAARTVGEGDVAAVGVTVMGGPQLLSAIAVSKAIRARAPGVPIIWGGAFPTGCPEAAVSASYVDYAVRSQGEETLVELLDALTTGQPDALPKIRGVSWRRDGCVVHNPERPFSPASLERMLPYDR